MAFRFQKGAGIDLFIYFFNPSWHFMLKTICFALQHASIRGERTFLFIPTAKWDIAGIFALSLAERAKDLSTTRN
jgi:hypothetical protein